MKARLGLFLPLIVLPAWAAMAEPDRIPLAFAQIDLLDGHRLERVVVRSYDAATDRFLVVASGTARLVSRSLVPDSLAATLREAVPRANGSVSFVADPFGPAPARHGDPENESEEFAPDEEFTGDEDILDSAAATEHRTAALARAERFYRYELEPGWSTIVLNAVDFESRDPQPVTGRPGRFRTEGKAYLEFYDNWSRNFQRRTSRFAVITEKRADESVRVRGFVLN